MVVDKSTSNHKAVENLVAVKLKERRIVLWETKKHIDLYYPNIHFPRKEPLWYSEGVEQSPCDVESPHEEQPAQTGLCHRLLHPCI